MASGPNPFEATGQPSKAATDRGPAPRPAHRYRLIDECLESRNPEELEALKKKDYSKVKDPSMLRFLIDLKGEQVGNTRSEPYSRTLRMRPRLTLTLTLTLTRSTTSRCATT